jgi:uncharacterized protein (TIRG00374 family)
MRRASLQSAMKIALRVAATVALGVFLLRQLDLATLGRTLESVDWRWWFAGLAVSLAVQCFAGLRWARLARPLGFEHSTASFVLRFFEGMFFSLCLPTSIGGDFVKAYRLADTSHGRLLAGCTVIADRLTGLSALGVLAGTTIAGRAFQLPLAATIALGTVLLAAMAWAFMLAVGVLDRLIDLVPASRHSTREFLSRLLPYKQRPRLMARAVGYSMVVQMGGVVAVSFVSRGLGLKVPLDVWFYTVPLVALATVLPLSISGVGIREGGLVVLLKPYGVSSEQAVAVGLLWFLTTIVGGLLGGLIFLLDASRHATSAVETASPDAAEPAP